MLDALLRVYKELEAVCTTISSLCEVNDEYNDIENVQADVDDCVAVVTDYLETRRDDPPSTESIVESWVVKHMTGNLSSGSDGSSKSGSAGRENETGEETGDFK